MHRKNSFATCLFSAAAAWMIPAGSAARAPQPTDVMPAPAEVQAVPVRIGLSGGRLAVDWAVPPDERLKAAALRAQARWQARLCAGSPSALGDATGFRLNIDCKAPGASIPSESDDESYTLEVGPSHALLIAPTAFGALHGLETLLQLPQLDKAGWFLPGVSIRDQPRFPWRGLMIDVARRWQPVEVIERNLDAMAAVKLNVLHLHLTDDQGFRIESLTHPELQGKGSDGLYFTQEQMRGIIAYAAGRGIRVVPEFDIPGHATSWVVSHPELASIPGPYGIERQWGVFNPVLDPTNEATYALLGDFLGEMASLFPDKFIHIGGDENNGVQWNANPRIQAFIRERGLKDDEGLHAYFNQRVHAILAKSGKRLVGWDEILHPGLPLDCVIDSWRGTEALAAAASQGYDGILSNGYYIDLAYPASDHYLADPDPPSSLQTPSQRSHILGGEATMWSEWVTPETVDSRIWPRTAAIAERLWSPADVRDIDDMYRRLAIVSARLGEAGALNERNRDLMLRHLVGENLEVPGVASLRTFVDLVEPVKHYRRGQLQPWANQLIPLVGIADAARPESASSREFAGLVDRMLFATGGIDRSQAGPIGDRLGKWGAAGTEVAGTLVPEFPALREAAPVARDLVDACAAGSGALQSLASGNPLGAAGLAAGLAALDRAGESNGSATELPVLGPIRLLVAAAAEQGERAKLSDEAWRARVASTAFPPAPADATH
jgi:hexosaminidase